MIIQLGSFHETSLAIANHCDAVLLLAQPHTNKEKLDRMRKALETMIHRDHILVQREKKAS